MDKIKITVDSKIGNVVTISYNLEKITIDVAPKKKKEKEIVIGAEEVAKDVKTEEKNIIDIADDDDMDVESASCDL
ncbi:hypothetical protein [Orthopoxvirus akhmetapox]|uniref:CPXV181 protein n=1 Tax=Orthopoxvirus akhmetapox TaxID=2200830 RepID=A0A5J6CRS8_9POXV|nr:hypothetical protein [Akhmeta virus]QEQ49934.1 hypothetical protein [Akhmeta virus]